MLPLIGTLLTLLVDIVHFLRLCLRPSAVLAAENLFLRQQLALYQERHGKPPSRHWLAEHVRVVSQPILGGLHHAYACAQKVA
jgi:hypothetical protein